MECPSCTTVAEESTARFCTSCGARLSTTDTLTSSPSDSSDDATGQVTIVHDTFTDELPTHLPDDRIGSPPPEVWAGMAATGIDGAPEWGDDRPFDDTIDDQPVGGITLAGLVADTIATESDPTPSTVTDRTADADNALSSVGPGHSTAPRRSSRPRPQRAIPSAVAGILTAIAVTIGAAVDLLSVSSTATGDLLRTAISNGYRSGTWHADDLSSGATWAAVICAAGLAAGAVGSALGVRWAPGLVAGSGLSATGLCAVLIALAQSPIRAAESVASRADGDAIVEVTITREFGWWTLLIAAGAGLVAFFGSLDDVAADYRNDANPIVAAIGAFCALAAAAGPTLATSDASWLDNLTVNAATTGWDLITIIARSTQLIGIATAGVVGFLIVRRSGLAMVAGMVVPSMVLLLTAWVDMGTDPVGPGLHNPGSTPADVHPVTLVALVACAATLAVAGAIAYDRTERGRIN